MPSLYLAKDVYSNDGTLLLAAGQEVNADILKKLESWGVIDVRGMTLQDNEIHYEDSIRASTAQIRENLRINSDRILDSASGIVVNIVFNSRHNPWWLYVNTLSNYVDWQYSHSINVSIISTMLAEALNQNNSARNRIGRFSP